jgi:chemotaxis protein CheZ
MRSPRQTFTAEKQRHGETPVAAAAPDVPEAYATLLEAIHALRGDIHKVEHHLHVTMPLPEEAPAPDDTLQLPPPEEIAAELEELNHKREEILQLRMEVQALSRCIQETKSEISALRARDQSEDRLIVVANELDAIVGSTEHATHHIMDATEKIDMLASNIASQHQDPYTKHATEEISDFVVKIFESCNFQDITGQRINKVVNTLKFIEDRVDKMMEIWGRDSFEDLNQKQETPKDDDKHLLNGPQLEGSGISQDEIDALFD